MSKILRFSGSSDDNFEIEVPDDTFVTGYADGVLIEGAGGQC